MWAWASYALMAEEVAPSAPDLICRANSGPVFRWRRRRWLWQYCRSISTGLTSSGPRGAGPDPPLPGKPTRKPAVADEFDRDRRDIRTPDHQLVHRP